jgi:hypothetical protein
MSGVAEIDPRVPVSSKKPVCAAADFQKGFF